MNQDVQNYSVNLKMYMNKYIYFLLIASLQISPGFGQDNSFLAISLLKDYTLAHKNNQLTKNKKNLVGYDDIYYVSSFCNTKDTIVWELNQWLNKNDIIPKSFVIEDSRVRISIAVDNPEGEIILLYRIYTKKRVALIKILFDSQTKINNKTREHLIRTYELIVLKERLILDMKCENII